MQIHGQKGQIEGFEILQPSRVMFLAKKNGLGQILKNKRKKNQENDKFFGMHC